jgi:hypothetical protein
VSGFKPVAMGGYFIDALRSKVERIDHEHAPAVSCFGGRDGRIRPGDTGCGPGLAAAASPGGRSICAGRQRLSNLLSGDSDFR